MEDKTTLLYVRKKITIKLYCSFLLFFSKNTKWFLFVFHSFKMRQKARWWVEDVWTETIWQDESTVRTSRPLFWLTYLFLVAIVIVFIMAKWEEVIQPVNEPQYAWLGAPRLIGSWSGHARGSGQGSSLHTSQSLGTCGGQRPAKVATRGPFISRRQLEEIDYWWLGLSEDSTSIFLL